MSASAVTTPPDLVQPCPNKVSEFRLIPRIEKYSWAVSFAQTIIGKLILLGLFGLGLAYAAHTWVPLILCLALISFFPSRRRLLVTVSTLIFSLVLPTTMFPDWFYKTAITSAVLAVAALLFVCASRWPQSWYGRQSVPILLCGFSLLVLMASQVPKAMMFHNLIWDFTYALSTYIWFIGYSLLDRNAVGRDGLVLQAGTYRPFWGSTNTPFAKGSAYLRRIEAHTAQQLAVTQLKGLKLLAWSILLSLFGQGFDRFMYGYLKIPTFSQAFFLSAKHTPLPWFVCWASLIMAFLNGLITLSVLGHRIIACCRMAGFNALRNTYRPLSSRTVAEFFNRYYYYFKEMLVDFFFYPTFLRYFKGNRKLRLIAAIFAAACFGNALFHFLRDLGFVQTMGIRAAFASYQVYIFYCLVLATAICISQLRPRPSRLTGFVRGQLWPSFCVLLFYCLLEVFDSTDRQYSLIEHFRFFAHLFNLNL
jgi:hypothetical protein